MLGHTRPGKRDNDAKHSTQCAALVDNFFPPMQQCPQQPSDQRVWEPQKGLRPTNFETTRAAAPRAVWAASKDSVALTGLSGAARGSSASSPSWKMHSTSSSSTYSFAATNDLPDGSAPATSTSARLHVLQSMCTPRPPSPTNLRPRTSPFCVMSHQYVRLALSGEVSLRIGSTRTHTLAPHGRADFSFRSSLSSNITHGVSSPARLHLGSRVVSRRLKVCYTFMTSIRLHTNRV